MVKHAIVKYSMLLSTNTPYAEWTVIKSDNKRKVRINCIKHILSHVDYPPDKISSSHSNIENSVLLNGSDEIKRMELNMNKAL
jgi:hypothetical protein